MNEQHALIWRRPSPDGRRQAYAGINRPHFTTTVLATGDMNEMQERWRIADDRLRRLDLEGHLEVRSVADPKVQTSQGRVIQADPKAARLAILPSDRVRVRIYGNTYIGTVVSTAIKGCTVRFAARTRKGGWGGEPPERERRFGVWDSTAIGSKVVEEVIQ